MGCVCPESKARRRNRTHVGYSELVKAKVITSAEDRIARHQATAIADHFAAFDEHLRAKGVTDLHREDTGRYLRRLAADCSFSVLAEMNGQKLERWLTQRSAAGMSARTRNAYQNAVVAFGNWCVDADRLTANPFARAPKANEKADPRRQRRALAESELVKLLDVVRRRPLVDRMTVRRGKRKGQAVAKLTDATRAELEYLGRERALIYKALVLTGLRKGELESLTVAQLSLDGPDAFAVLDAADEKNREGNDIALRSDLAGDLRDWLADKLARLQAQALKSGAPIPARLPGGVPVFTVPQALVKILDRDLVAAGLARLVKGPHGKTRIDKRDDRGRTLDVHALRTTFGTLLSKGGMRHSDTDPKLLDVRDALDALPALPLDGERPAMRQAVGAERGSDLRLSALAPLLAPPLTFRVVRGPSLAKLQGERRRNVRRGHKKKNR